MTTFLTEAPGVRVPNVSRVFLTVLAGLFFAVGWALGTVWAAVTWVWAAVSVGFLTAHRPRTDRR